MGTRRAGPCTTATDAANGGVVRAHAHAWTRGDGEARLLERIGDARFVLLGEASHGTFEFYRERAELTKRLVTERGFRAVAVEADWPDAYRVHRYVMGRSDDRDARAALAGFERFPHWMWRNEVLVEFVDWLRAYNDRVDIVAKVGFYGIDLYSLHGSIDAIVHYLDRVDPEAATRARERYACFERFGGDTQLYGYATVLGSVPSCEEAVLESLVDLQQRAMETMKRDGRASDEEALFLEQNARLVVNAEAYYRAMFRGDVASWNLRDAHMADTLDVVDALLARSGPRPRIAVWAHNSHLGDARATEVARQGEHNVGQLVRERHPGETFLVGFTTYDGTVTAARDWDGSAEQRTLLPALPDSYEAILHATGRDRLLVFPGDAALAPLHVPRLERAVGVVYRPETERLSHWLEASLADQFDAVIHIDRTRALEPLERAPLVHDAEAPETYPSAL